MDGSELALLVETVKLALLLTAPLLLGAIVTGMGTGTIQATTTIHDSSISSVPKLLAGALVLMLAGPWMMSKLVEFTLTLLSDLGRFVH